MSVLIRGEEMPKNCVVCKNYEYCELWSKLTVNKRCKERHPDCPIVEVKEPHGDLADKDKLMQEIMDSDLDHLQRDDWREVIQIVSDADVVIEAEGETK